MKSIANQFKIRASVLVVGLTTTVLSSASYGSFSYDKKNLPSVELNFKALEQLENPPIEFKEEKKVEEIALEPPIVIKEEIKEKPKKDLKLEKKQAPKKELAPKKNVKSKEKQINSTLKVIEKEKSLPSSLEIKEEKIKEKEIPVLKEKIVEDDKNINIEESKESKVITQEVVPNVENLDQQKEGKSVFSIFKKIPFLSNDNDSKSEIKEDLDKKDLADKKTLPESENNEKTSEITETVKKVEEKTEETSFEESIENIEPIEIISKKEVKKIIPLPLTKEEIIPSVPKIVKEKTYLNKKEKQEIASKVYENIDSKTKPTKENDLSNKTIKDAIHEREYLGLNEDFPATLPEINEILNSDKEAKAEKENTIEEKEDLETKTNSIGSSISSFFGGISNKVTNLVSTKPQSENIKAEQKLPEKPTPNKIENTVIEEEVIQEEVINVGDVLEIPKTEEAELQQKDLPEKIFIDVDKINNPVNKFQDDKKKIVEKKEITVKSTELFNNSLLLTQLDFDSKNSKPSNDHVKSIRDAISSLDDKEKIKFKVISYAYDESGKESIARRVSLQRSIAVRAIMVSEGLKGTNINVQALGSHPQDESLSNSIFIYKIRDK